MALASGNARRASRMLERYGLSVPHRTLYRWRVETFPAGTPPSEGALAAPAAGS